MKVEYTGRHTTIFPHLKAQAAEALERIGRMLGRSATAHVILTEDKYRMIAEVTVTANGHSLVATCKSAEMAMALHDALAKIEQQAIKQKDKFTTLKRHSKMERGAFGWGEGAGCSAGEGCGEEGGSSGGGGEGERGAEGGVDGGAQLQLEDGDRGASCAAVDRLGGDAADDV